MLDLIGVLTGMRSSEVAPVLRSTLGVQKQKNGITFHWMASVEHKTKKGPVEYMMPSMGYRICNILERWSAPDRVRLTEQIKALEQIQEGLTRKQIKWLAERQDKTSNVFWGALPVASFLCQVVFTMVVILTRFARDAGVEWKLAPHQMRRLDAYTLSAIVWARCRFSKSSSTLQHRYDELDCLNPLQDSALYDDILK